MSLREVGVDITYAMTGKHVEHRSSMSPVDADRMIQIVERLEMIAKQAGKRWPSRQLVGAAVEVYNFLLEEEAVDDAKLERVLKLVVSR